MTLHASGERTTIGSRRCIPPARKGIPDRWGDLLSRQQLKRSATSAHAAPPRLAPASSNAIIVRTRLSNTTSCRAVCSFVGEIRKTTTRSKRCHWMPWSSSAVS
jgi:hypothetical protein